MKKIRLLPVLCLFIVSSQSAWGQQQDAINSMLCKEIEHIYLRSPSNCFFWEYLDRWYFVSIVYEEVKKDRNISALQRQQNLQRQQQLSMIELSQISRENVNEFFILTKQKKFPRYTYSSKTDDISIFGDLTELYETTKKELKNDRYKMPFIGTFLASVGGNAHVFAKELKTNKDNEDTKINDFQNLDIIRFEKGNTSKNKNSIRSNNNNNQKTSNVNTITLMVYGTASSEDDAIKIALRSAIEQAFGTFVSANTEIVNDELVKDEIVSVSSGNIENYSLISSEKESNGNVSVSVKATVSIGNLIHFAESKGASVELAGASFAMNMKMIKLNKENEKQALIHMFKKMIKICDANLFDFECKTEQPKMFGDKYRIPTIIEIRPNFAYKKLVGEFLFTLKSLSLTQSDKKIYQDTNIKVYTEKDIPDKFRTSNSVETQGKTIYYFFGIENLNYALRNDLINLTDANNKRYIDIIHDKIFNSYFSFKIEDNMGNAITPDINDANKIFVFDNKYGRPRFSYNSAFLGLDMIRQRYVFKMRLSYDEEEIAKLSSIRISPVKSQ